MPVARHIAGLVVVTLLVLLLYWFWQDGQVLVRRSLRSWPALRTIWSEFSLLISFFIACVVLGTVQKLWDMLPSGNED